MSDDAEALRAEIRALRTALIEACSIQEDRIEGARRLALMRRAANSLSRPFSLDWVEMAGHLGHQDRAPSPTPAAESDSDAALTTKQAAKLLGLAAITISQMRARGEGPRFFRAGRWAIRYRLGDVLAFRDARAAGRK